MFREVTLDQLMHQRYGQLPICPDCGEEQISYDWCVCRLQSNEEAPYRQIGGDSRPPRESSDLCHD